MENVKYLHTFMVDDLGDIRDQIKQLKKQEAEIKDKLLRTQATHMQGRRFMMTLREVERTSIDTIKLKHQYGLDWYSQHCKSSYVTQLITTKV